MNQVVNLFSVDVELRLFHSEVTCNLRVQLSPAIKIVLDLHVLLGSPVKDLQKHAILFIKK